MTHHVIAFQGYPLDKDRMSESSQFDLLRRRRFLPLFLTQSGGAFTDNTFRNALIILITFSLATETARTVSNLAAGLFILPFFLFSATAGQIADKFEKAALIRLIKAGEVVIMALAALAFALDSLPALLALLFLMGTQSAFFGPLKYGILPQHLSSEELLGGNGLIEMGTFLAILLGTLAGGVLVAGETIGPAGVGLAAFVVALLGWTASRSIPTADPTEPGLRVNPNPLTETWRIIDYARADRSVFLSILGISWFWMLGSVYLTQFPAYAKTVLGGDESLVTLLLVLFSLGIGLGSLLCEKLSGHKVELGLVPFGSIGLTLFGLDLVWAQSDAWTGPVRGIAAFLADPSGIRVAVDLFLIGVFGGFYIVPLYAVVQSRADPTRRARIIAANNVLNALFMVIAAGYAVGLFTLGLDIPQLFLTAALLNALVAIYIYTLVPEFAMRFLVWLMTGFMYNIRRTGMAHIPEDGAAVLVCNHVTYVDALIIAGSCRRPVRFVMDHRIFRIPVFNFIFRTAGAIPIAPRRDNRETYEKAFERIAQYLRDGDLVCIFPEGMLTRHGEMNKFRPGITRIIGETPVPVVPMALSGLWGSMFSFLGGRAFTKWPRRFRARITFAAGAPIQPKDATLAGLNEAVAALRISA